MTNTIPLNKLVLSPRNVRKTNGDEDIAGLAESIASKGLLQNLVVSPAEKKGTFEVDAGGRRWRALNLLAGRGDLPRNWPVPVIVIGRENATEASLAENMQKVAMNPADEVEAFAAIIQSYSDNGIIDERECIANCSRRFGVTERYVRQRLALAALAPEILAALREGEITITAATAYATHPDPGEQLKVFKAHQKRTGTYGKHDPREIRDALKGRIYQPDHQVVRYIGLDAYTAAGGRLQADLFCEEGERDILLDAALIEKLATQKAEREAQDLAHAGGWLDAVIRPVTAQFHAYPPAPKGYRYKWASEPGSLPKNDRAEAIAYFGLSEDATISQQTGYFVKEVEKPDNLSASGYKPESREQYEARLRTEKIRDKAFRLAAPKVTGTPLEGRLFWPPVDSWSDVVEEDHADPAMLVGTMLIRIPKVEVDAQLTEAERRYELEQQELREEAELLAAEEAANDIGREDGERDGEQDPNVNDVHEQEAI